MRILLTIVLFALSAAISAMTANAETVKPWTLLLYINGNNDLDPYATMNLKQMEKLGSNANINIVAQWASLSQKFTHRMLIQKSTNPKLVTSPVLQNLGIVDMGNWQSLVDFIQWGVAKFPARHFAVVVWDHGSGWHQLKWSESLGHNHALDISWDDNSGHFITTQQLGQALAEGAKAIGHKIDLYGNDACLMAMAEVANEVSDSVEIFAGSEETEPDAGWPYDKILQRWSAKSTISASEVGQIIAEEYTSSYLGGENGNLDVTYSAFDLEQLGALDSAIADLGYKLRTVGATEKAAILKAVAGTQNFAYSDYGDLMDFLDQLGSAKLDTISSDDLDSVRNAARQFVISNHVTPVFARATGLSIWLPGSVDAYSSYSTLYSTMKFAEATHWDETLKYLVQ